MSNKLHIKILNFKFGTWEAKQVSGRNLLNHAMVMVLIMILKKPSIKLYSKSHYDITDRIGDAITQTQTQ